MRRLFVFWACVLLAACSTGRNEPPAAVDGQSPGINTIEVVPDEGGPRRYESKPPPPPPPAPALERDGFEGSSLKPAAGSPGPRRVNYSARVEGTSIRLPATDTVAEMEALPPQPATDTSAEEPIEQGLGAFIKPPDVMRPQTWYKIDFVVAANAQGLKSEAGEETTEATQINIAPVMRVTLVEDQNFKFKALTSEVQKLAGDKSATWAWNVMPLRTGTFMLEAKVEVLENGEVAYDYTRKVAVQVKVSGWQAFLAGITNATSLGEAMQSLLKSWQGALVAFLAFLGVLTTVLWKLGIIKKRPEATEPPGKA